jgi:hypothetical protein
VAFQIQRGDGEANAKTAMNAPPINTEGAAERPVMR